MLNDQDKKGEGQNIKKGYMCLSQTNQWLSKPIVLLIWDLRIDGWDLILSHELMHISSKLGRIYAYNANTYTRRLLVICVVVTLMHTSLTIGFIFSSQFPITINNTALGLLKTLGC